MSSTVLRPDGDLLVWAPVACYCFINSAADFRHSVLWEEGRFETMVQDYVTSDFMLVNRWNLATVS